jgi:phosphatidylglycerophosphatase A
MRKLCISIACFVSTTFGLGYFPVAPGTMGSAAAIIGLWFLPSMPIAVWLPSLVMLFLMGVWMATIAEKAWGHDAGRINIDEVVGMAVTVIAVPKYYPVYIVSFFAFRFFDIVKPFPINISQKLPRGWGVMIDDVLAGIYGNIIVQIVSRLVFKV